MLPVDVGAVGSPVDVATFFAVVLFGLYELRPVNRLQSAALVALAREERTVDDELLQADLDVDDDLVDKVRPTMVCGGGVGHE